MKKIWVFNPHRGGAAISLSLRTDLQRRIDKHAAANYAEMYTRIELRFRGPLCYMEAYREPEEPSRELLKVLKLSRDDYLARGRNVPVHLGRLRHLAGDRWSYAFYKYSDEKYEPCTFPNGTWFGSPEEAFDIGARYLGVD
jgi:hypothetical protein